MCDPKNITEFFSSEVSLFLYSYLLPLKQAKTKRKTPVIKKARAAYWDYKTEYDADYDDLPDLGIEFTVSGSSFSLLRIAFLLNVR